MSEGKGGYVMPWFQALEDPRIDRCERHQFLDIIAIAICAVICGADSWVSMVLHMADLRFAIGNVTQPWNCLAQAAIWP